MPRRLREVTNPVGRMLHWIYGDSLGVRSLDGYASPDSQENRRRIARFALQQGLAAVTLAVLGFGVHLAARPAPSGMRVGWVLVLLGLGVSLGPAVWFGVLRLPLIMFPLFSFGVAGITTAVAFAVGPSLSLLVSVVYVMLGTAIFVSRTRRAALLEVSGIALGYASVVVFQSGNSAPFMRWIVVVGAVVSVGMTVAWLLDHVRVLAEAERRATQAAEEAQAETAELNRTLEERISSQVNEIASLGRLRRFLSTPVADALLDAGGEDLLAAHRREISVLFCDLRGFTSFAGAAQPEEVHQVLDEYFEDLGRIVGEYQATVGGFTGDGLMAFFNDPMPVADPAMLAVQLAVDMRSAMDRVLSRWSDQGFHLGFGVGVAFGYANIGMIGFEGRRDYSAIGPVVNLAARLCGEARPGEILVDRRVRAAVEGRVDIVGERSVSLKGYRDPVDAFVVSPKPEHR